MEVYKNLFKGKTDSELLLLYKQFLESEKSNGIPDNELGKIRDEYCKRQTNGILMMILDLTRTVADKWYAEHKPDEDSSMFQDDFIAALQDNMVMNECDFCTDLRNIEPAAYISCSYGDPEWLIEAKKNKQFIMPYRKNGEQYFVIVDKCPVCGHVFTEEDYDEYL